MRRKVHVLPVFIAVMAVSLLAQPEIRWRRPCFNSLDNSPAQVCLTRDGAYAVAGTNRDSIFIALVSEQGTLIWRKVFASDSAYPPIPKVHSCIALSDRGFALTGTRTTPKATPDFDAWIMRLDSAGALVWEKIFGLFVTYPDTLNEAWCLQEARNGDLLVAGMQYEFHSAAQMNHSAWVCRLDPRGATVWSNRYDGKVVRSLIELPDGAILAVGDSIRKIGDDGKTAWIADFSADDHALATAVRQSRNGAIVVIGEAGDYSWLHKKSFAKSIVCYMDTNGAFIWKKTFGDSANGRDVFECLLEMPDSGYLLGGSRSSQYSYSYPQLWLLRTAPNGAVLWTHTFSSLGYRSSACSVVAAPDSGFTLAVTLHDTEAVAHVELLNMTERVATSIERPGPKGGRLFRATGNGPLLFDLRGRFLGNDPTSKTRPGYPARGAGVYVMLPHAGPGGSCGAVINAPLTPFHLNRGKGRDGGLRINKTIVSSPFCPP